MLKKSLVALSISLFISCGIVKKKTTYGSQPSITVEADNEQEEVLESDSGIDEIEDETNPLSEVNEKADLIIDTALSYAGVRYKYGGTTEKGIDCSGLLYVSFLEHDVSLPRVSHYMANEGMKIDINEVVRGDLLFFTTTKRRKRINHVGLVVAVEGEEIKFIHSTTSRGVIVSSLQEGYWNHAFVKATRVL